MKKILFFINTLRGGGAEKVLVTLVNNLCLEKDYEITVQVLYGDGVYHEQLDKKIHQKIIIKKKHNKMFEALFIKILCLLPASFLYKVFIREKYDIEIAYLEGMPTKIISGSKRKTYKFAWVHIDPIEFPLSTRSYFNFESEKKSYRVFDGIYCVSESVASAFEKKYDLPAKVIHNVVDEKKIKVNAKEKIDELVRSDCIKMITVGRLEKQKGYERLLRIMSHIKRRNFDFELYVLGIGSLELELKELTKYYDLEKNVIWKGFVENPYPYMKAADFYVCSSLTEGYSTSVTESIVLGVPVITTSCAGMQEIFGGKKCGIITNNTEKDLEKGLIDIFENPQKLDFYKKEAMSRSNDFSMKKQLGEFKKVILEEKV